jgi:hypothetical protein
MQKYLRNYEKMKIFVSTLVANNEKVCWVWKTLRRTDNLLMITLLTVFVCQLFYVLCVQTVQKIHC